MPLPLPAIDDVGQAIQLALTPAFLLTALAGLLNVMTGRLARIIDRGRAFTEGGAAGARLDRQWLREELQHLERRRQLASWAIHACTLAALLICTVIATLFIEAALGLRLTWLAGLLFTAATLAMVTGLASFLREVQLAMLTIRIPPLPDDTR